MLKIFIFCLTAFHTLSLLFFSTPAFSTPAFSAPPPLAQVIRYTVLSQNFHFVVLQRWFIYDYETESSFVYLIFAVLLHKFIQ